VDCWFDRRASINDGNVTRLALISGIEDERVILRRASGH